MPAGTVAILKIVNSFKSPLFFKPCPERNEICTVCYCIV